MDLDVCTKVGNYRVVKYLGGGGFGKVYEVVSELNKLRYALKIIDNVAGTVEYENNSKLIESYSNMCHPNIVCLYDVVTGIDDKLGLVFELMDGDTDLIISKFVDGSTKVETSRDGKDYRPKDSYEYINLVKSVTSGLSHIHRSGYAHLDIKPPNILYKQGFNLVFKLGDLGITCSGNCLPGGTKEYVCPYLYDLYSKDLNAKVSIEMAQKCDMWSLAITLLQILFGESPVNIDQRKIAYWKIDNNPSLWHSNYYTPTMQKLVDILYSCLTLNPTARSSIDVLSRFLEQL